MASDVTLFHFPGSLCSQKVRLALAEKGVTYEKRGVDIELRLQNYDPWYLRLNPRGVVPTLVHGELVVTDSARILRYIDEHFDGAQLIPADAAAAGRMEHWIEQQDRVAMREISYSSFKGALGLVLRNASMPLRLRKLRRLKKQVPDLATQYEEKIDDVVQWRATIGRRDEMAEHRDHLHAVLKSLEDRLGQTQYIAGDTYSLADVAWTCVLARLRMLGLADSFLGSDRRPRVEAYYKRVRNRPSFEQANLWETMPLDRLRARLFGFATR